MHHFMYYCPCGNFMQVGGLHKEDLMSKVHLVSVEIPSEIAENLLLMVQYGPCGLLSETDREIAMDALKEALGSIDA